MRFCVLFIVMIVVFGVASTEARAAVYADGATENWSAYADIQDLDKSAGGTSEPDDSRASFKQKDGTATVISVTYDFPDFSVRAGTHTVYLIVDADVKGTVAARVTSVNGDTGISSATSISIAGLKNVNKHYGIDFAVTEATDITSITFLILMGDANKGAELLVDAVALPEPGTWLLFALGATGLGLWSRRRRKRPAT